MPAQWWAGRRGWHASPVSTGLLIVDDDAAFRDAARALLGAAGFDVAGEAGSGGDALRAVAAVEPSVVLLDVQLPDCDGFEVVRRLRQGRMIPIVVLISTREAADYGRRIAESGVAGFITKSRLSGDAQHAILRGAGRR